MMVPTHRPILTLEAFWVISENVWAFRVYLKSTENAKNKVEDENKTIEYYIWMERVLNEDSIPLLVFDLYGHLLIV